MRWVPRSPYEKLAGYHHLPRFIDKTRAYLAGKLPPEYQNNFCKGFDARFLEFTGLQAQDFIQAVAQAKDDAEVARWVQEHARPVTPEELEAWNEAFRQLKPRDPERIARMRAEAGHPERTDVETYFDLIDLDEGRDVPRRDA